jgi:hypothetical protein
MGVDRQLCLAALQLLKSLLHEGQPVSVSIIRLSDLVTESFVRMVLDGTRRVLVTLSDAEEALPLRPEEERGIVLSELAGRWRDFIARQRIHDELAEFGIKHIAEQLVRDISGGVFARRRQATRRVKYRCTGEQIGFPVHPELASREHSKTIEVPLDLRRSLRPREDLESTRLRGFMQDQRREPPARSLKGAIPDTVAPELYR